MIKKTLSLLFSILTLMANAQTSDTFWLGADTGWDTEMASKGHKWYNWQGEERECTALMKEMGMNAIRMRVWVDPSKHDNWCSKEDLLVKARRAKELGMEIMVDFHYSDWWADPAKQNIPAAWAKHSYKQMLKDVANHTTEVLTMLRDNGIEPRWVQVGNETTNGLLWSVEMDPVTGWEKKDANGKTTIVHSMGHAERNPKQYASFISAGYDAVKHVFPKALVIVHLDNGYDNDLYNWNLDILRDNGAKWDIIGMSLYPYWSIQAGNEPSARKTIIDCIRNIRKVTEKYGTDVMIVETGYEVDEAEPWKMVAGREHLRELIMRCKTETNGRCRGVFYWEPECRPSQYKLGAFTEDGHPTDIMRAYNDVNPQRGYDRNQVIISTTEGDIIVELYNETPRHRDNFLRLVKENALDSMLFHRVIAGFMIQSGDPASKTAPATSVDNPAPELGNDDVPLPDGSKDMAAEIIFPRVFHKRGALAAARESDDDNPELRSAASEFYIVWGKSPAAPGRRPYVPMLKYYETTDYMPGTPWLDGGYTVFGEVVEGLDVVERIQEVKTDRNDRPLNDIRIVKTTIR